MSLNKKSAMLVAALFLLVLGAGLLIAAFCVKPPGEISDSVLVAFGEILAFDGTVFGINHHYNNKSSLKQNEEN